MESDRTIARIDLRIFPRTEQLVSVVALIIFFASGFSALLYQVIWQRMLGFFSGADVYSVTIIVAAYMAGMGIGSLTGGIWQIASRAGATWHYLPASSWASPSLRLAAKGCTTTGSISGLRIWLRRRR